MPALREWKFEGGGWLQVYQAPDRAGGGSCTLSITDAHGEMSRLREVGFETGEPQQISNGRMMMISDLDGNSIALVETSDRSLAQ